MGQVVTHEVPLKNLPDAQLTQLVASDPLQVKHVASQAAQVLLEARPKKPAGHVVTHEVPLKNLPCGQLVQLVASAPLQFKHVASQAVQVLLVDTPK